MAISYLKNAANLNVIVHANASGNVVLTGNTSDIASPGENVIGTTIKQVWCGSISGGPGYWLLEKGFANGDGRSTIGVYDSTAWIDYAGNGCAINIDEDAEALFFTLNGSAAGYISIDIKKITGP